MPSFVYEAMTTDRRQVRGTVSAPSRPGAISLLASRGEYVTQIDASNSETSSDSANPSTSFDLNGFIDRLRNMRGAGIPPRTKVAVFRQIAVTLQAGLPLITALQVVEEQTDHAGVKRLMGDLEKRVQGGEALSDAMAAQVTQGTLGEVREFSPLQVSMVRVGETAGVLDEVMGSLAAFAERDLEVREKLRSAMIYPAMVMVMGLLSIVVIMVFVLPKILSEMTDAGPALPLPTRMLMGMSDFLRSPLGWLVGIALVVGVFLFVRWTRTPAGRLQFDTVKLKTPVIGPAIRDVAVARFARTLGTLTGAGIQIVESMRIVRDTLGNEALAVKIDEATKDIVQGQSIAEPLKASGYFPPLLTQIIAMGERTGKLDELLVTAAESYEKETAYTLQRVMSIVPVLIVVALAGAVAFILAAALLPIFTMDFGG